MSTPAYDAGRLALMLNELRLPTIARLWPEFAQRSDKEGWQATRLLGALLEHEPAERRNDASNDTVPSRIGTRPKRLQPSTSACADGLEGARYGTRDRRRMA
jgi:hypothetical protein